jgi:hypothetical protein
MSRTDNYQDILDQFKLAEELSEYKKDKYIIFMKPKEYTLLIISNGIEELLKIDSDGKIIYRGNIIAIDKEIVSIIINSIK